MKNILKYIYVIVFILISLAPALLFVLNGQIVSEGMNIEKTRSAEVPVLIKDNKINELFDDECETWLNQNLPYRAEILSAANAVLSDVLLMPTANVVPGKDGFLYSTETIDNYMDVNAMSEAELKTLGVSLSLIQEKVEASGAHFLFVPVPNKNTIYDEYMPKRYPKASENNLTRVYAELDRMGVNYVDLKQELLSAKETASEKLYYKRDTHWNTLGAITGYKAIASNLGKTSVVENGYSYLVENTKTGDLDKLLYPSEERYDEEIVLDERPFYADFSFLNPADVDDALAQLENFMSDREDHDNDFTTKKNVDGDGSYLYMIRDSFARAMLPYMIETYDEARFVRSSNPSFEKLEKNTDVVYEICERNLDKLIITAPVMYAPLRDNYLTSVYSSDDNTCYCEDEGYAYKVYGTIDSNMIGDDGRIYIRFVDEDSNATLFEAFPIYDGCYGFSAYLNKSILEDRNYQVMILSGNYDSGTLANIPSDCTTSEEKDDSMKIAEYPYSAENDNHRIVLNGVPVGIGDNINSLKSRLGNQSEPVETIYSCLSGTDGLIYHYPDVTFETDMDGNIYYISMMADSYDDNADVATEKGIALGSDKMDIWEKLGTPSRENDKNCIFKTEHIKITYSYKSGAVTSVILEESEEPLPEEEFTVDDTQAIAGLEYVNGHSYLYDENHELKTGWQIIDGEYYFFDRITGERIVNQTVDGIEIGLDGEVSLTDYEKDKVETMIKAHNIMESVTSPSDSMEEKRKKVFDWVLGFPYHRHRKFLEVYRDEGIEILEANDIFDEGSGDCVSESAALAFLFHEIGYTDVYWVHDTGHSWVRCEDRLFDPLFAEGRDYDANYNAPFTDYRATMAYSMLIY